jgi:hypothetical protein
LKSISIRSPEIVPVTRPLVFRQIFVCPAHKRVCTQIVDSTAITDLRKHERSPRPTIMRDAKNLNSIAVHHCRIRLPALDGKRVGSIHHYRHRSTRAAGVASASSRGGWWQNSACSHCACRVMLRPLFIRNRLGSAAQAISPVATISGSETADSTSRKGPGGARPPNGTAGSICVRASRPTRN